MFFLVTKLFCYQHFIIILKVQICQKAMQGPCDECVLSYYITVILKLLATWQVDEGVGRFHSISES